MAGSKENENIPFELEKYEKIVKVRRTKIQTFFDWDWLATNQFSKSEESESLRS